MRALHCPLYVHGRYIMNEKFPYRHYIKFNPEERNFLDTKFKTNNRNDRIQKIKEFLLKVETVITESERDKKVRLENKLTQIKIYKELKSLNFTHTQISNIINDNQEFKEPSLPFVESEPKKSLIHDSYCEECKHYHARSEPHVCTLLNCSCEVRF